jgi:hypothetical protein
MVVQNHSATGDAVSVDYVVDGERTAAAVAAGRSRLLGMTYSVASQPPCFNATDPAAALRQLGPRPHVYHDSLFSCAVELTSDLPLSSSFDDTHIMLRLLQEEPSAALKLQHDHRHDHDARVRASLDRVRRTDIMTPHVKRVVVELLHIRADAVLSFTWGLLRYVACVSSTD